MSEEKKVDKRIRVCNVEQFNGIHMNLNSDGTVTVMLNTEIWRINVDNDVDSPAVHIYRL